MVTTSATLIRGKEPREQPPNVIEPFVVQTAKIKALSSPLALTLPFSYVGFLNAFDLSHLTAELSLCNTVPDTIYRMFPASLLGGSPKSNNKYKNLARVEHKIVQLKPQTNKMFISLSIHS